MNNSEKSKKTLDDAAGLVGGVAGLLNDVKRQVREDIKSRVKDFADQNEFVQQDEMLALKSQLGDLLERVEHLEKTINKMK
jgi:polyhydroxyalkanoate synthesis regulator phasin